jgi:hypothetical protein
MGSASLRKRLAPHLGIEADKETAVREFHKWPFDQFAIGGKGVEDLGIRHGLDSGRTQSAITLTTGVEERLAPTKLRQSTS